MQGTVQPVTVGSVRCKVLAGYAALTKCGDRRQRQSQASYGGVGSGEDGCLCCWRPVYQRQCGAQASDSEGLLNSMKFLPRQASQLYKILSTCAPGPG